MLGQQPWTLDRVVRIGFAAVLVWGAVVLLKAVSDAVIPFLVGLLLAYILNPAVGWVEEKVHSRAAAIGIVLGAIVFLGVGIAMIVGPLLAREVAHMARLAQEIVGNSRLAAEAAQKLPPDLWEAVRTLLATPEVQDFLRSDSAVSLLREGLRRLVPGVMGLISGAYAMVMAATIVAVIGLYTVFLLVEFRAIRQHWQSLLPPSWRQPVAEFLVEFDQAMSRYFRGQTMVAGCVGILFAIGFALVGLPLALLLGALLGLLNMVPYLQILGFIPAILLSGVHALDSGTSLSVILGQVLLVFAGVQLIQDLILTPRFLGRSLGLSPAWILLSLSVWGSLLGFLGLLLALPLTCLALAYWRRLALNQGPETPVSLPPDQSAQ
jgi:predicted PurR-regulated permease PerM